MFLEISPNSQESTCARVPFLIQLQVSFNKNKTLAQVFSYEFCKISKNIFFKEHIQETAYGWFSTHFLPLAFILYPQKTSCFQGLSNETSCWLKKLSLHKKMKFFIEDFFSKCDQIRPKAVSLLNKWGLGEGCFRENKWNLNLTLASPVARL